MMVEVGGRTGKRVEALITDMNQPLGRSVGNSVEVVESIGALKGEGPGDLAAVTIELAARMLLLTGTASTRWQATEMLETHIDSGAAFEKFREMVRLHGGDVSAIDDVRRLPAASINEDLRAACGGYVQRVDAGAVGRACVVLGAGRRRVEDGVDHAAGVSGLVKVGEEVKAGSPLARIHGNDRGRLQEARAILEGAFTVGEQRPPAVTLVRGAIGTAR
jgi:pyrimidine-nucleoside phosphorylase